MKQRNTIQRATARDFGLPDAGFARLPAVSHAAGIGSSTVWLWVRKGKFPSPLKIGPRVTAWRVEDVRQWMADPAAWASSHTEA